MDDVVRFGVNIKQSEEKWMESNIIPNINTFTWAYIVKRELCKLLHLSGQPCLAHPHIKEGFFNVFYSQTSHNIYFYYTRNYSLIVSQSNQTIIYVLNSDN